MYIINRYVYVYILNDFIFKFQKKQQLIVIKMKSQTLLGIKKKNIICDWKVRKIFE